MLVKAGGIRLNKLLHSVANYISVFDKWKECFLSAGTKMSVKASAFSRELLIGRQVSHPSI